MARRCSSVGQSKRLISAVSGVQIPSPLNALNSLPSGRGTPEPLEPVRSVRIPAQGTGGEFGRSVGF